jgi:molecular chaperone GrpE
MVNHNSETQKNVEDMDVNPCEEMTGDTVEKHTKGEEEATGRLSELNKELETFKQRYYYLAAEFENYKKRVEREKESLVKFGNEKILMDLLGVIDNFDRTLLALKKEEEEKIKNIALGIDMIHKQVMTNLKKYGLEAVASLGKEFDPNLHEAVGKVLKEEHDEDSILEEYQKGYTLHGRLMRPAKVMVSTKGDS